jgi:hypothetical protein
MVYCKIMLHHKMVFFKLDLSSFKVITFSLKSETLSLFMAFKFSKLCHAF